VATFDGWENAFVAMSVALGVSVDEACERRSTTRRSRVWSRSSAGSVMTTREGRARALAAGLAHIMLAIEKTRLA
jgi:hypothetical protein